MTTRDFVSIADLSSAELDSILTLASELKGAVVQGRPHPRLAGQVLALVFQKPSLRTRASFEVGMYQLGGHCMYLSPAEVQLGEREGVSDVARVLSRYVQGIVARTYFHSDVLNLAQWADVPIINGLSDQEHPCQALADLLTIREHHHGTDAPILAWIGDGNNVAHSLMLAAPRAGVHLRVATPPGYEADAQVTNDAIQAAGAAGLTMEISHDPVEAVRGAHFIATDAWFSMGEEDERDQRKHAFHPFQINGDLLQRAGADVKVMHCLPAHRGEEITDEVLDSSAAIVFDQAENRLHAQKALLCFLLGDR
ncbi:MAG: ornithine carbamoyltransferase [Chloroflexota bacterium]